MICQKTVVRYRRLTPFLIPLFTHVKESFRLNLNPNQPLEWLLLSDNGNLKSANYEASCFITVWEDALVSA